MNDADEKVIQGIQTELMRRQKLLVDAQNGRATWSSDPSSEDRINPTFIIGKDLVRKETGRTIVRDVLLNEYADKFENNKAFRVSRGKDGEVIVQTRPAEDYDNTFKSLNDLRQANARDQKDQSTRQAHDHGRQDFD